MNRALRRHHMERIKRRVSTYYGGWAGTTPRNRGMVARSRQHCSCPMCGNPRKYFGDLTPQERRAEKLPQSGLLHVWYELWEPVKYSDWELFDRTWDD